MEKALGCSDRSGTISATIVRMIPTMSRSVQVYRFTQSLGKKRTIAVPSALDGSHGNGHGQTRRHAPNDKADHGTEQTKDDGRFPAVHVGRLAPSHGGDALGYREDS